MSVKDKVWYLDYIRTTDDKDFVFKHFIRDFVFQHRLRYIIYFRIAQNCKLKIVRYFCEFKLFCLCRKYGVEIKTSTKIGAGFVMVHPYNITITPFATIGKNVNILKGATIGISGGTCWCPSDWRLCVYWN